MLVTDETSFGTQPFDASKIAGATMDAFPDGIQPSTFVDYFPSGYERRFGDQSAEPSAQTNAVAFVEASAEMIMVGAAAAARG